MTTTAADLTVIVPTRGRPDILAITLEALARQTERGFETVVVVDGTDQPAPDVPGVRVLRQEHAGPGVARNHAVLATERPLILFIGDDMVPRPGFVAAHLAHHRREPAVETAVLGRSLWHPRVPNDPLHRWLAWSGALFDFPAPHEGPEAGWFRFYSSNVSLKRALFERVGGFDPDFVFDYEDLDFGYRIGQEGVRLLFEPKAITDHLHPYDWAAVRRRYESRAGAERLMASKHDWFEPWFRRQVDEAIAKPRVSRVWTRVVDHVPARPGRVSRAVHRRADRYYLQRLHPAFDAAWKRAEGDPRASAPQAVR